MDARNSSDARDLRCLVREKLIEYMQKNHPESLPRYRGEFEGKGPSRGSQWGELGRRDAAWEPKSGLSCWPSAIKASSTYFFSGATGTGGKKSGR